MKIMLLNLAWLIPGLPIFSSVFVAILLLSFTKTMNRLTKPVSYFLILSLLSSEIINFIFFKNNITGNESLFSGNFELVVDKSALIVAELIGLLFLFVMVISFAKLDRKNGYVRYFIFLGLFSGLAYLFSFSGGLFHDFYDPLISTIEKIGISF